MESKVGVEIVVVVVVVVVVGGIVVTKSQKAVVAVVSCGAVGRSGCTGENGRTEVGWLSQAFFLFL